MSLSLGTSAMLSVIALALVACADSGAKGEAAASSEDLVSAQFEHDATYAVAIKDLPDDGISCSGALIAPRVVVTAEHCLNSLSAGDVDVRFGNDAVNATRHISVKSIERVTAEGRGGVAGWGADVAFLVLSDATNVPPVAMLDRPLDATDLSLDVRLVAYGQNESRPNTEYGRYRRTAPGVVSLVTGLPHAHALDADAGIPTSGTALLDTYEAQIEPTSGGYACTGDSGGPWVAMIDGAPMVVGLQSAQSFAAGHCSPEFSIVASFGPEVQAAKARALAAAN